MHPNPKRIAPLIFLALLATAAWFYFGGGSAKAEVGDLAASGTIEALQVMVAPEVSGQIAEVLVQEGEAVQAGQVVARLNDSLLQAQLEQAQAALALAQANYDLVAAGLVAETQQAAITAAELELTSAQQALQNLYDTAGLARAQAVQNIAAIDKDLKTARDRLSTIVGSAEPEDIERAEAQVVIAADYLKKVHEDSDKLMKYSDKNVKRAMMDIKVADAQAAYDATVTRLSNLLGHANQWEEALAEANVSLLEAQLLEAQRLYGKVAEGPDADALALAEARRTAAEARLEAAKIGPTAEMLAVAQAQVDSAQKALDTLLVQLGKLTLKAPVDGVVLLRAGEPGEMAVTGSALLTLADLADLTLTIYVPEERYGQIRLGQSAQVRVDSFAGQVFDGAVVQIADQAEFTPRNVQTVEGRRSTVYAIQLAVANPKSKLKPGMPADVEFED